jgi:hypothetical protein
MHKSSWGKKAHYSCHSFTFLCRDKNTSRVAAFKRQNFGLTLGVNCYILFVNIINFVWCQMVLIVYFCLQIRKMWEHLYFKGCGCGLCLFQIDVRMSLWKAMKPVNPCSSHYSEWFRTIACRAKLISHTSYFFCGETDQSFLLNFHLADQFCFLLKSNINICPSVLTLC